jgi:hypothetical protein
MTSFSNIRFMIEYLLWITVIGVAAITAATSSTGTAGDTRSW